MFPIFLKLKYYFSPTFKGDPVFLDGVTNASNTSYQEFSLSFTPGTTDIYYFAIRVSNSSFTLAIGFDDFSLVEIPPTGTDYTYTMSGGYDPSNPSGVNEPLSTLTVLDGTAVLDDATTLGSITVKPGAVLDPDADVSADFVFESTALGSGQLANRENHSITGSARVENFIPAQRAFRSIASSVGDVSVADSWQLQTHVTGAGGATNGFDVTQTNNPSMFEFDHLLSDQSLPWVSIPDTDYLLEAGTPYFLMVRGDRDIVDLNNNNSPSQDVTLVAEGTLHTGNFDVVTSDYPGNYTLVGNPYQAVVDLNNLTYGADVNYTHAHYWDPQIGTYGDYVEITLIDGDTDPSSSNANQFLRPGQAVFIRNSTSPTGSDFSIQFNEDDKATGGTQTTVFSTDTSLKYVNLRIYTQERFLNNQSEEDAMALRFTANGNNLIDENDALKMFNQGANISSLNGSDSFSIEHRAIPQDGEIIPLSILGLQTDIYTFLITAENFDADQNITLVDHYTNDSIAIDQGTNQIEFTTDTSIPESISESRFQLVFENETFGIEDSIIDTITLYPIPVEKILHIKSQLNKNLTLEIYNSIGQQIMKANLSPNQAQSLSLENIPSGVYLVKISDGTRIYYKKIIKK
jgi:hypothetical protein